MYLLIINALKGLKKKKVQMLGIVFLIFLGSAIYTTMNLSLDRMEDTYYEYIEEQKVQDFGLTPNIDYRNDYSYSEVKNILDNNPELSTDYKNIINIYMNCLKTKNKSCLTNQLLESVEGIFLVNRLNEKKYEQKISNLSKQYNFTYEYQESKSIMNGKYSSVVFPYVDKNINKPYLIEGRVPQSDNEITVLKLFAENNDLEINSLYTINDAEYKIVGYMYSSDYIYQMMSITSPMYDAKYNNIIFTTKNAFNQIVGISQNDYVGIFNDRDKVNENFLKLFNIDFEKLESTSEEKSDASLSMSGMLSLLRTRQPEMEFVTNRLFAEYFMYFLLSICVLVILIITKKRIDDERLQIGVLKSLGYKARLIATSYLVYPIVGSLIGGLLGYFCGYLLNPLLTNTYKAYYCFPIGDNTMAIKYLINDIFIPMIFLSILSYLVSIIMLRKKPLYLLREGSNLKVNLLTRFTTFITKKMSFNNRFKYSLASRSIGKLSIIFLTSLASGMLIILTLIGMNLFNSMIDKILGSYHFNYQLNYLVNQTSVDDKNDYIYSVNMDLEDEDQKYSISLMGIDSDFDAMDMENIKGDNLIPKIKENQVIISRPVSEINDLQVSDKITLIYDNKEYTYDVVGIYEDYFNMSVVINKKTLEKELGLEKNTYNIKLTKEKDYDKILSSMSNEEAKEIGNMLSIDQLKNNMDSAMDQFNASMYIVILFASLMSLIIIAVIANIVVEENKKTISLMKVMGYKNKIISKIVLNIYTPFIILAYLASIPLTIMILKSIVKALMGDMNISIPITLSYDKAFIGLLGLLIAYYIAIFLSKKTLNKVPLAVALKRE